MPLRLYNTLTRKKEIFKPARKGEARMYSCGPTVYSHAHIGNFRSFVFADLLRRYLEWKGFRVKHIMNITDVGHMTVDGTLEGGGEDKVEKAAKERSMSPEEVADHYTMAFFEDICKINLRKAYFYPRATDHIGEMQAIIRKLLEKGFAYRSGGSVYFDIGKFPDYGKLSGNTLKKLQAGRRVGIRSEKKSPLDFALWISNPRHLMQWPSPWGRGYPGWHIECSAMGMEYLGPTIDIHTGGEDNIFPHHECEIAQSEAFTGKRFARYWLHARHLFVEGKKMSKSLGNFHTLRSLLKEGFSPREVRFLLLSAHYRTRLNFTRKGILGARESLKSLDSLVSGLSGAKGKGSAKFVDKARKAFEQAMDDDLNVPRALSAIWAFAKDANSLLAEGKLGPQGAGKALDFLMGADSVLGLELGKSGWLGPGEASPEVKKLLLDRERLRKVKDWKGSDSLRERLRKMGVEVEDTSEGPRWRLIS